MNALDVKIVELPAMRVVSVHAFGSEPEPKAWKKLQAWAKTHDMEAPSPGHRVFGFNNPNPSPGSPNYGYEFWVQVGPEIEAGDDATIKEFSGGRYAVTRCVGVEQIVATWKQLVAWRENSLYRYGDHQWLEEHISMGENPDDTLVLDLYMPIKE